jgi:hypothetical protein
LLFEVVPYIIIITSSIIHHNGFYMCRGQRCSSYLIDNTFSLEADNFLSVALTRDGYKDIRDVANMSKEDIDSLEYSDANDDLATLPRYLTALIRIFKQYIPYRNYISDPIGDGWTTFTAEQFDTSCMSNNHLVGHQPTFVTTAHTTISATKTTPQPCDLNSDFKKTTKLDSSVFMVYKGEKQKSSKHNSKSTDTPPHDIYNLFSANSKHDNDSDSTEITINVKVCHPM